MVFDYFMKAELAAATIQRIDFCNYDRPGPQTLYQFSLF